VVVALTTIVVGGALSWRGAVIGAILFTWLPTALAFVGDWQELVYGAIVVLAAIFLPAGLYGLWCSVRRRLVARLSGGALEADAPPGEVGPLESSSVKEEVSVQ